MNKRFSRFSHFHNSFQTVFNRLSNGFRQRSAPASLATHQAFRFNFLYGTTHACIAELAAERALNLMGRSSRPQQRWHEPRWLWASRGCGCHATCLGSRQVHPFRPVRAKKKPRGNTPRGCTDATHAAPASPAASAMAPRPRTMDERKKSPQPPRGPMGPLKFKVGQLAARWPHNIEWVGSGVEGGFFRTTRNDLATICVAEKKSAVH